jgi:alanine-alpha-ketoisovalerate/valine-pyruvate aminotransferase
MGLSNPSLKYPVYIHNVKGGNSLWLYLKNLPLGDLAIANLLKSHGLIVNPGSFFFPEKLNNWNHSKECIHININGCMSKELETVDILDTVISNCYSGTKR